MLSTAAIAAALLLAVAIAIAADRTGSIQLPDARGRIGCIDGLRGYLATGVVIHHFVIWLGLLQGRPWEPPSNHVFQNLGQGAVVLFFMVTGALFYGKISDGFAKVDWRALYVSRAFRLAPLFWFVFLLVNLIVFIRQGFAFPTTLAEYAPAAARWLLFIDLPPIGGDRDTSRIVADAPWTLTYEWICYFALPLLAVVFGFARPVALRLFVIAVLALSSALAVRTVALSDVVGLSLMFAVPFLLGMMAIEIARQPSLRKLLISPWAAMIGGVALTIEMTTFASSFAFTPSVILALFFAPVAAGNSYFGVFSARPSIVLGEASYGIYLLHGVVLYIALADAKPFMERYGPAPFWLALPFIVAAVVAAAILAHGLIEKPAIRAGRSLARSRFLRRRDAETDGRQGRVAGA